LSAGNTFKLFEATNYSGALPTSARQPRGRAALEYQPTDHQWHPCGGHFRQHHADQRHAFVLGDQLTLSWPADHTGWTLQTNAVDITFTNDWFALPGSRPPTRSF